jgi:Nucleoside-diphosphate-sugar pyrophosphorylase involved in lipopolysaccharide biosynthesis/translation initiation factor 2B, gamma/epsilon subunits (eIF-2Bgamma/eIF-2Bepsilon)
MEDIKEAIVLAGGKGTRLQSITKGKIPKSMAQVDGIPLLTYILEYLYLKKLEHVILSVGYKKEIIMDYYKDNYKGIKITYALEQNPLGTGGGIAFALRQATQDNVLILNGDSYIDVDLSNFYLFHQETGAKITMAIKQMHEFSRYGTVAMNGNVVSSFCEKKPMQQGIINLGAYIVKRDFLRGENMPEVFSFEEDYLNKVVQKGEIYGYLTQGYFIDIGVPEDYQRAQKELRKAFNPASQEIKKSNINEDIILPRSIRVQGEMIVERKHSALSMQSGQVNVLSTPALSAFMEKTAWQSIRSFLPEGYTTVGMEINVKHLKATPIGQTITCTCTFERQDGRRVYFSIECFCQGVKISSASHIRYIVNVQEFIQKTNESK